MLGQNPTSCVVVGIDGSQSAVDAALWAIDGAVEHDVPLRLVYVVEPTGRAQIDPHDEARRMAAAQLAVRDAQTAVASTERPVKTEVEILQGRPVQALLEASRSAGMLCVGARGLRHATHGRIGSTAAALSSTAQCPVAIVRTPKPGRGQSRSVVIEIDDTAAGSEVLQRGLDEARRRGAPVRVLTSARNQAVVHGQWERRLAEWQRRYPEVDITQVRSSGDSLDYISAHADSIQLVVSGRGRPGGVNALVGARGNAALRDTDCSILICAPHNAL